jgi:16S rRNA C967 or C1407 C5-methylase (RsmB/RsmF family)/NOL1/NOP2/fmu family ribosome biogenesis protein
MLQLPIEFTLQMKADLGIEAEAFFEALRTDSPTSIRYNPNKQINSINYFEGSSPINWATNAYYLGKRPSFTFDPYFHAGHYYVQEASSMFLEEALKQCVDLSESLRVLDLCAAPGGKSTHLSSLISDDSILISNEVISTRASILVENLTKWGKANVIVCNNDPEHFSDLEKCFDVVVIDAPCSGEGMFRKDKESINEWNLNNVNICSARQKRILHTASKLLRTNGVIIYSTCTFNTKEDIDPINELLKDGGWESIKLNTENFPGIVERISKINNEIYGYHFYPHKIKGEGFYISVLKKTETEESNWPKVMKNVDFTDKKTKSVITDYIDTDGIDFIQHNQQTLAFPINLKNEMLGILNTSLRIKKFGIDVGQVIREELIPDQALAMSSISLKKFQTLELSKEQAIMYLQKKDFSTNSQTKGWHLMKYNNAILGFAKLMGNRMNNAYPKEWRIRSEEK